MTENEQKEKSMLQEYYETEAEKMKGQPWYIRHKSSLLILGLTIGSAIFCIVWSIVFPNGIM